MYYSQVIVISVLLISHVVGQDLIFKNSCPFNLWAEGRGQGNSAIPGYGYLQYLPAGGSVSWNIPAAGLASTRFWVKYGCDSNGANCLTGDQVPNSNLYPTGCPSTGCTPPLDSLFEATWGCKNGASCGSASQVTWFDTSQVDGYTLPYKVHITGNNQCDCTGSGCTTLSTIDASQLSMASCPTSEDLSTNGANAQYKGQNLKLIKNNVAVACKSPCKHLTLPAVNSGLGLNEGSAQAEYYCCPTPNPSNCQPSAGCITSAACRAGPVVNTKYVATVHAEAPGVYAYTYDDLVGLHTCPAAGVQYTMEYCPAGSPAYPGGGSSSSSSSTTGSASSSGVSSSGCTANCGAGLSCCGSACYSSSQYACGQYGSTYQLCPVSTPSLCGTACYSSSVYKCVNGGLQHV